MIRQAEPTKHNFFVRLAAFLLLLGAVVDGWDWWTSHDAEVLSLFQNAPIVGGSISGTLGPEPWRERVTIAVDASYPPFASVGPDGTMAGFEVDLAAELGRRLSADPSLVNMDAGDALFDALASKKVDAIVAGLTYYPEITRDVAYSAPYFEAGPVLLVRRDRADITSARDLGGKRVAVELGSLAETEARRYQREMPGMVVKPMDDVLRVIAAAGDGSADAAIVDRPALSAETMEAAGLGVVGSPLRSQPYMVAVQRKNIGLLLAINRELHAMKADGSLAAMEKRWFK